jgi:Domain of unknown function (DUF4436)
MPYGGTEEREGDDQPLPPEPTDGYEPLAGRVVGLKHLQLLDRTPLLRTRVGRIAFLVLVVVLPVTLAVVFLNTQPDDPTQVILRQPDPPGSVAGLGVSATLKQLDTTQGQLLVQLTFAPNLALANGDGLRDTVEVQVNDNTGNGTLTFFRGSTMQPRTATLSITGSRVQQYPFDSYRALLNVSARFADSLTPIPVAMDVAAALADFTANASDQRDEGTPAARTVVNIDREKGVVLWALLFMILCWALAVSVASLAYLVLVRTDAVPFWMWGFIIGILFALPNLRTSLPGDPPFGSAVDWGAFYWAVLIVALSLIGLVIAEGVDMTRRQREGTGSA